MTIVEFLNARLDEDEAGVREWRDKVDAGLPIPASMLGGIINPYRALDEIAAKRAIIHQHGNGDGGHECPDGFMDRAETEPHTGFEVVCMTQRHLASVYAEHPDYDQAWRP